MIAMAIAIRDISELPDVAGSTFEWMLALWLDESRTRDLAIIRNRPDDGIIIYGVIRENMKVPKFHWHTFAECLWQLFAGLYYEPFTDGEIRQVLFHLGGESAVSAYESGVPLDDVFAGW